MSYRCEHARDTAREIPEKDALRFAKAITVWEADSFLPVSSSPRRYKIWCRICGYTVFSLVHDLFAKEEPDTAAAIDSAAPLATRMRPRSLDEFVGQEHILGPGKLLRRAIEADRLPSVIFSGPPGSGKTTLARIIAEMTHAKFIRISGVESNVAEMRRVIAAATNRLRTSGQKTILFIDE